jgi:hypothetical protein
VGVAAALVAAMALSLLGYRSVTDELHRAFWSLGCAVMLLVLAWKERNAGNLGPAAVDWRNYGAACAVVLAMALYAAGPRATLVIGAVAFSLLGLLMLLVCLRIPCSLAIGLLLVQSVLFLTWPVWTANLLVRFDSQWLVDLLVRIGPLFAINGAIDLTDPFTHRPMAYRLMNLGQDIPYQMPRTIGPSVAVHALAGLPGVVWYGWKRRPLKGVQQRETS